MATKDTDRICKRLLKRAGPNGPGMPQPSKFKHFFIPATAKISFLVSTTATCPVFSHSGSKLAINSSEKLTDEQKKDIITNMTEIDPKKFLRIS